MRVDRRAVLSLAAFSLVLPGGAVLGAPAGAVGPAAPASASTGDASAWRSPLRPRDADVAELVAGAAVDAEVVVSGLNNPRQLALGPGGGLYVAEAGRGGDTCAGEGDREVCVGATGAVSFGGNPGRATDTRPRRIATGFISVAGRDGTAAGGVTGVSKQGAEAGEFYTVVNFTPLDLAPPPAAAGQLGTLIRSRWSGRKTTVADIAAQETAGNPDQENVDSNPYSVLSLGQRVLVADAAGDTVYSVSEDTGEASVFAVVDTERGGRDPVPTSLARGPDRTVLVGTLGEGEEPGAGEVRVYSRRGRLLETIGGFSGVVGSPTTSGPATCT